MNNIRCADPSDTIFAMASGTGRSAIAVIRLSGPACRTMLNSLCAPPPPRTAHLRTLRNRLGDVLDRAIVLWLPAPHSYTGEDSAELHLHGGQAVLAAVTGALLDGGARPAEPGEFTRRAFLAGRIDLLEAEAVADLVDAETPQQRAQALRQLGGDQSRLLQDWTSILLHNLALQEATIDFSEEDLPDIEGEMLEGLLRLHTDLEKHASAVHAGERLRRGLVFVISGPPNVGKSSILNIVAGCDAAIVAETPGTTRDPVAVELVIAGIPVTLVDTAGLRETDDEIEAEGVKRARARAADADLILEVADACSSVDATPGPGKLLVANKIDLAPAPTGYIAISALTGQGVSALMEELEETARRLAGSTGSTIFNRARHGRALRDAETAVAAAIACRNPEMRAEELRLALQSLGRINGQVDSEDLLDVVFGTFCIGK